MEREREREREREKERGVCVKIVLTGTTLISIHGPFIHVYVLQYTYYYFISMYTMCMHVYIQTFLFSFSPLFHHTYPSLTLSPLPSLNQCIKVMSAFRERVWLNGVYLCTYSDINTLSIHSASFPTEYWCYS